MTGDEHFLAKYRALEARMKARAEEAGHVFVPNPTPPGKVDSLFICMEPSLGAWARSRTEAEAKVRSGFRNFLSSFADFILHFSIRNYLCEPGQQYHVTDVSKGAMLVQDAATDRQERYDYWYTLLLEEVELLAKPASKVFAVGNSVAELLRRRNFPRPFTKILHYSPVAAGYRSRAVRGREQDFEEFCHSIDHRSFMDVAREVLRQSGTPENFRRQALNRLSRGALTESRLKLIFTYKVAFDSTRPHWQDV